VLPAMAMVGERSGLSRGEVHVYSVAVEPAPEALRQACLRALQPAERARYDRLVFERDRWPAIVGRGLLRHALSRYADVAPSDWRFEAPRSGKPRLAGPAGAPSLTFSVTNTTGLAACAIALDRAVGVDAEPLERRGELTSVARECLTDDERADVERLPPPLRTARILEYWTLKEAYLKAVGVGLSWPLRGIAFEIEAGGAASVRIAAELGDRGERWAFARRWPSNVHVLAVAAEHVGGTKPAFLFEDAGGLLTRGRVPLE
jgi:4'-phosphopantetheinyl transferase